MLQYQVNVALPPLSLSSSRKHKDRSGIRSNDSSSRTPPVPPLPSKLNIRRSMHAPSSIPSALTTSHPHTFPLSPINVPSYSPSSPASPTYTSSPVSLPGPSASHPWRTTNHPSENASSTRRSSVASSFSGDVLSPGDVVGEGIQLQGEDIRLVSVHPTDESEAPAQEFEVIRRLGTGSYAVVYLVREVLSRPVPSTDGHLSIEGMELDDKVISRPTIEYGRDFAIKCLSKVDLDGEEALVAQKAEVTIHQSLRSHPNIATLHRTLETSSFLLLLLEFVPGEDLFYFLEKARDHYEAESPTSEAISSSKTPPTPSLLSNLHPSQLLSRNRLRLIASMFSQMCDAVAACHDQQVFHRDIKPENFIVTDGWSTLPDGSRERKVVVKLTDFGLSTTDPESSDMDCGSAPYMSYECRNNVAPTYKPRAADVWSLGIVLINMLYHCNPWQDTACGTCNSFDLYRKQPVTFFMQRFNGMTRPVAEYLASKVFCILDDPKDDSQRVEARDFGTWIKDLPALFADTGISGHKRVISTSSTQGFPIAASVPPSRRPSSRQADINPHVHAAGLRSRAPSLGPAFEVESSELPTLFDQDLDRDEEGMYSRSTSTNKRRKRGARKGKGSGVPTPQPHLPGSLIDDTLETLATASQSLAREISKASRSSSKRRGDLPLDSTDLPPVPVIQAPPVVSKKASKWKLGFGKNTSSGEKPLASPVDEVSPSDINRSTAMSATASNVTNLIMGLSATTPSPSGLSRSKTPDADQASSWARGRRSKSPVPPVPTGPRRSSPPLIWDHSAYSGHLAPQPFKRDQRAKSPRALSPSSTRSGRPVASSASSMASSNWRNSTSSASSSAFTSYSNSSSRSVSTQATSVSASSWRTQGTNQSKPKNSHSPVSMYNDPAQQQMPKNVKFLTGVPWELNELPRQMHLNPVGDIFGSPPPPRKQRVRNKPKDQLDTIAERSGMSPRAPVPVSESQEAMESHLDLEEVVVEDEDGVPKKVQKGQINALAKMLSALRR